VGVLVPAGGRHTRGGPVGVGPARQDVPWPAQDRGGTVTALGADVPGGREAALGHAADPTSAVASIAIVPAFAALALTGLVPLLAFHRHVGR
jgi:hypothetical protein